MILSPRDKRMQQRQERQEQQKQNYNRNRNYLESVSPQIQSVDDQLLEEPNLG